MTDFQKALGILNKAKQGSLLSALKKPEKTLSNPTAGAHPIYSRYPDGSSNHHPKTPLGITASGQRVRAKESWQNPHNNMDWDQRVKANAEAFTKHHKDWTAEDHRDASKIHSAHAKNAQNDRNDQIGWYGDSDGVIADPHHDDLRRQHWDSMHYHEKQKDGTVLFVPRRQRQQVELYLDKANWHRWEDDP